MRNGIKRLALVLLTAAALASTGCHYMNDRGKDAMRMFDIGITVSPIDKPGAAVYAGVPLTISAGGSYVDGGKFFGIANQQAGWLDYEHKSYGLLMWGALKQGAGEYNPNDIYIARDDQRNLTERPWFNMGPVRDIAQGDTVPPPAFIECDKFVHVGYVGILFNCRFLRMVNFVVGWTGLDLLGDREDPLMPAAAHAPAKADAAAHATKAASYKAEAKTAADKTEAAPAKADDAAKKDAPAKADAK